MVRDASSKATAEDRGTRSTDKSPRSDSSWSMHLTPERMASVIEAVIQKAEAGDLAAAKLLWQYGMGKPAQTVQPDRMDIEELGLYREQQLSPEAWLQIINSMPADMACRMLRPLMPVLSQSAAKHLRQMARESGTDVSQPVPSPKGG